MLVKFKFAPKQFVIITAFGLNYQGRVGRCITYGTHNSYSVEFAFDGKIEYREFYEDELITAP